MVTQLVHVPGLEKGILEEMAQVMNFTYEAVNPPDHKYGILEEDNVTYSGLLGVVQRGEAAFCGSALMNLLRRAWGFDFIMGYHLPHGCALNFFVFTIDTRSTKKRKNYKR